MYVRCDYSVSTALRCNHNAHVYLVRGDNTHTPRATRTHDTQQKCRWVARCDERLKTKTEESTRLPYTGFLVELEHLKIETTLIDEMFASVMGEYVFLK
jgi:hypothetical protein